MFQETRQPAKRWSRAERQRPVVAAGLGHCGTGMSPKGKGGRKKKVEEGSFLLARVSDVWTHGGGGLLSPTRAAPPRVGIASSLIGRGQSDGLFGAVAGARDRGAAIGFFFGSDHFFPSGCAGGFHRGEPGLRLRCRSTAGPLGCHSSCAGCLLAGVEDWKKAEMGDSPLVRTASRHRTCALVRLSTSSTSDERQAPRFHGGCLGVGLGDRRPQT